MPDEMQTESTTPEESLPAPAPAPEPEVPAAAEPVTESPAPKSEPDTAEPASEAPAPKPRPEGGKRPDRRPERGERPERSKDNRPPRTDRPPTNDRRPEGRREGSGNRDRERERRPEVRRPEGPVEIEYDKLISDSLYLDNHAHILVSRLRDLDAGTRSQLRRLYGAVRRACRAVEADRQHQFVMLRARLAYTIARHGLRSLDPLEKLLLQVTRRNESRGYDRFRDLFEAIIAYNE